MITINTTHNLKIVPITAFAPGTPPALNIFLAWQLAQQSTPAPVILVNTPYYYPSSTATFESVLKPPVQPVYDANYAALVGIDAPNGLIVYPVRL
jgi:hypothetical protein